MSIIAIRCSSLDRLFTCHASRVMEDKVAAKTVDPFGGGDGGHTVQWAGSWCHHAAASRLRDEFGSVGTPDPLTIPASFKPSSYDEWVSDWYVRQCMLIVPSDYATFIEREVHRDFVLRDPAMMLVNGRWIEVTTIRLTGHLDFTAISPDLTTAIIADLKRGYEIVDAAECNWQLAGYAALLLSEFPSLSRILLRLLQPAAPDRVTESSIPDPAAVVALIEEKINDLARDPFTFSTGKPCKYCLALEVCPVFRKDIRAMKETLTKEQIDALPEVASTEDLGELAYHCKKLHYPMQRVVDVFRKRVEQEGGPVTLKDGTVAEIVTEEGSRQISDVRYAHSTLAAKVGENAAWDTLKMGIGAVEESLAATGMQKSSKKKEVETVKSWVDNNLGSVIKRPEQKTLVFK